MNLPVPVAIGIWIAVGVLLLVLILTGRRRAAKRSGAVVPVPPVTPADLGAERLAPVEATYVATTLAGQPLARVGAHGLGDRAAAAVSVHDAGVLVARSGTTEVFVPAAALRGVTLAAMLGGKYLGADGIVVLSWQAPSDGTLAATSLDTGLRTRYPADRDRLVDAVAGLLPGRTETLETPATPEVPEENS